MGILSNCYDLFSVLAGFFCVLGDFYGVTSWLLVCSGEFVLSLVFWMVVMVILAISSVFWVVARVFR